MSADSKRVPAGTSGQPKAAPHGLPLRWRLMLLVAAAVVPLLLCNLGYQYLEYREYPGPAFTDAVRILGIGCAVLALGLILALFAAQRIAGPIDSLRRLAAASDRDSLPELVPTGLPEVDEVALALLTAEEARR